MCVTLGSDQNSDFYRGANFFENVKTDEKKTFSIKSHKCAIGFGLSDVFLSPAVDRGKTMCVTLGSDQNSDFYRGANFFENVKTDEKKTFSTKSHKCVIGFGLSDVFRTRKKFVHEKLLNYSKVEDIRKIR